MQLSSTLSKMLKKRFGKGPEACYITFYSNRLIINIRNFITPAEEVLVKNNNLNLVHNFRAGVMEEVFREFSQQASTVLGTTFDTYFNDWDYDTNTGILLLENGDSKNWNGENIDIQLKEKLYKQIISISSDVHKVPNKLQCMKITQNMVVVECEGILLQIENILLKKGYIDVILEQTRDIKKSYLERKELFEHIFNRVVEGMFITWDFQNDRNCIFFYLK